MTENARIDHDGGAMVRAHHDVRAASFGDTTGYRDGDLVVNQAEGAALFDDPALASVTLSWAHPGDPVRIVKVLDAVAPRAKDGGGGVFPGFLGAGGAGAGTTHALRDCAVVVAGYLPRAQEAIVDMAAPGSALSPLGATHNLVVEFAPADGAPWEDVEAALRVGTLRLAERIARAAAGAEPDDVETLAPVEPPDGRPRVGVVTNLQTQGAFKDVYVNGAGFAGSSPRTIDANEVFDGAIVSGQYGHPALRNPTFVHQNHPIVEAVRAHPDLAFAGLVIAPEPIDQSAKEAVSDEAAALCERLGFDAAIVTKEGGGNADADVSLKLDRLEERGIAAVGVLAEMAGPDGTGPPLVVPPQKATALVSTGNYDARVELPEVEHSLGGGRIDVLDARATDAVVAPMAVVVAALSPLGWGRARCEAGDAAEAAPPVREPRRPARVVHYVNQFFAGLGGEDAADTPPGERAGAVGPGNRLQALMGDDAEIVATVFCGDDRAAASAGVGDEVVELARAHDPDVVVAGPAFTSGRYGLACARVGAAAARSGVPAVIAMHDENPGIAEAGASVVVRSGPNARGMGAALDTLAAATLKVARGEAVGVDDGRIARPARIHTQAADSAARRAAALVAVRLRGDRQSTEIPPPRFDRVTPAAPVDPSDAVVALVTEGALVPSGNPDRLESARATRWLRYRVDGGDVLAADDYTCIHGGFSTVHANADPHRIVPLDAARALERDGLIGKLHTEYLVTAGNGTSVANARRFGVEWAAELRRAGVQAAILTAT